MKIIFHPHAIERISLRGALKAEVANTVRNGERFQTKFGRCGFRKNHSGKYHWRSKIYNTKQIEAICVEESNNLIIITVIVRYF